MNFYKNSDNKIVISKDLVELEGLKQLKANVVDAAVEKHVPLISVSDKDITVTVGEVLHPMGEDHYIEFILIDTEMGYQIKYLKPGDEPIATFKLTENDKLISAYCYCNLHGLWMSSNN